MLKSYTCVYLVYGNSWGKSFLHLVNLVNSYPNIYYPQLTLVKSEGDSYPLDNLYTEIYPQITLVKSEGDSNPGQLNCTLKVWPPS